MVWSLRVTAPAGKRVKLDHEPPQCHDPCMEVFKAARYARTGSPAEVVACEEIHLPPPGPGEARVRMICAPINPADLNMLEGKYGETRPLPDTPGNEGLGEVVSVGARVDEAMIGRNVLVGSESWRAAGNWPSGELIPVPPAIYVRRACVLRVNPPTAWLMLHKFIALQSGDWVCQNAATSAVGRAVIEIAKARGWKTLNVVRRPESADGLRALGADAVLVDSPDLADQSREILGRARPKLGLNAVGGASATRLAGLLEVGGTLVTYGAMSKEALKIPNGFLIFRDLILSGFWLTRWLRAASAGERESVYAEIFRLATAGAFVPRIAAEFPLERIKEAVASAAAGGTAGKVLLRLDA